MRPARRMQPSRWCLCSVSSCCRCLPALPSCPGGWMPGRRPIWLPRKPHGRWCLPTATKRDMPPPRRWWPRSSPTGGWMSGALEGLDFEGVLARGETVTATVTLRVPPVILPGVGPVGGNISISRTATERVDDYRQFGPDLLRSGRPGSSSPVGVTQPSFS